MLHLTQRTKIVLLDILYPFHFKNWDFGCVKAPSLNDHKQPHISNIGLFMIVQSREFSHCQKPILEVEWVYHWLPRMGSELKELKMAFIGAVTGVLWSTGVTVATTTSTTTAMIAKEFFLDLFINPFNHFVPLLFFAALFVVPMSGVLYLVKKAYDRYCSPPAQG